MNLEFSIHKTAFKGEERFIVAMLFRPVMEDTFERATHVARFEAKEDADAFTARVKSGISERIKEGKKNGKWLSPEQVINRGYWQGPTSPGSPIRWDATIEPFEVLATPY